MRTSLFILGLVATCFSWGPVGHETIAYIAEDYISPATKQKIEGILGKDTSLADVANWADQIRSYSPDTRPWHYIDMDVRKNETPGSELQHCLERSCITEQIHFEISTLSNPRSRHEDKQKALKYLIHFMGDIHQPLHCANDGDHGGNDKVVFIAKGDGSRKKHLKLHAYWDHLLEVHTVEDPKRLAKYLEKKILSEDSKKWSAGTPEDWAFESYRIARERIYADFPAGPDANGLPLPRAYYSGEMRLLVNHQLRVAGIRLAFVLESILGKK